MKSVLFAYHDVGCQAIRTLHAMGEEICAVFTHREDPDENLWFESVERCARKLDIPVYAPENVNTPEWTEKIRSFRPDILFSFYYRKLISEEILAVPPKGGLNLHGSLLPRYRGRAPVNWVLVNGEKETGLTLHYMVKEADAGDIVCQKRVKIAKGDTALTLYRKLVPLAAKILKESVPALAKGTAPRIPQDHSQATVVGKRRPEDGRIDWTRSSEEIYNLVRAVTHPYPGAFSHFRGGKIFIWRGTPARGGAKEKAGTILSLRPLHIRCGGGILELKRIQMEGAEEMNAAAWARKHSVKPGEIFEGGD